MAGHRFIRLPTRLCATRVVALLLMCSARLFAAPAGEWPSDDEARRIAESVKAALPGCEVTETARNTVPEGWHTHDSVGFLIRLKPPAEWWVPEGNDGTTVHLLASAPVAVWLVPRDWVGFTLSGGSKFTDSTPRRVWVGREYKATVVCSEEHVSVLLGRKLQLKRAELDGSAGDWWSAAALFGDGLPQAVEAGRLLLEEFCKDDETRIAAAESLRDVGVPATDILSEIADKGRQWDQQEAIRALGRVGSRAALRSLCTMLRDSGLSWELRATIAEAMVAKADATCGPALVEALAAAQSSPGPIESGSARIAEVLGRIRYMPSAPKLLELLANTDEHRCRNECARALAGIRYAPAVPVLRAILASPSVHRVNPEVWEDRRVGNALLQLTGPWGEPGKDVRLLIEPQKRVVLGGQAENWLTRQFRALFGVPAPTQQEEAFRVNLYVENVSTRELDAADYSAGRFRINGRWGEEQSFLWWSGEHNLEVNEVWDLDISVPEALQSGGWKRIAYETHGTVSNEITIFVWTPSLVLVVGWAVSLGALGAALAAMAGVCRMGRWRLGLGGWKREIGVAIAVSLIQAMVLVVRVFDVPGMGWGEHALAFVVVVVGYKVTHRKVMRWRAVVPFGLVQQAVAIGVALLACAP